MEYELLIQVLPITLAPVILLGGLGLFLSLNKKNRNKKNNNKLMINKKIGKK